MLVTEDNPNWTPQRRLYESEKQARITIRKVVDYFESDYYKFHLNRLPRSQDEGVPLPVDLWVFLTANVGDPLYDYMYTFAIKHRYRLGYDIDYALQLLNKQAEIMTSKASNEYNQIQSLIRQLNIARDFLKNLPEHSV